MNNLNNRRLVMLDSVTEFGDNHPLTPAIARVTLLYGQIAAAATTMRNLGGSQVEGFSGVRSAASESIVLRDEVLSDLRALNKATRRCRDARAGRHPESDLRDGPGGLRRLESRDRDRARRGTSRAAGSRADSNTIVIKRPTSDEEER
jgi:hypothetical protein